MQWDQQIFVARLNIEHFREMLAGSLDAEQRRTVSTLLAEEEARLAALKSAAGERDLLTLVDLLAQRAGDLFRPGAPGQSTADSRRTFILSIRRLPVALGLADTSGRLLISNDPMLRYVPSPAVSHDPDAAPEGKDCPPSPFLWPVARALHGHAVTPGIDAAYTAEDGRKMDLRVVAMPVRDGETGIVGAMTCVYEVAELGRNETQDPIALMISEEINRPSASSDGL